MSHKACSARNLLWAANCARLYAPAVHGFQLACHSYSVPGSYAVVALIAPQVAHKVGRQISRSECVPAVFSPH
jgi:hypothetical protein